MPHREHSELVLKELNFFILLQCSNTQYIHLSAFISIKTGFCFSIFYFLLKGDVFNFECSCTNLMPPYKIPEWQCLNEIVVVYFQSLLETLARPHTLMFIHVTTAVYSTKHLIALSWRRSSFEGRLSFCIRATSENKLSISFLFSPVKGDEGAICQLPGHSSEDRERVKRLKLPDNPRPLKALQEDVTCVR